MSDIPDLPDREPTFITPERAQNIWAARGPFGEFRGVIDGEYREVSRVWQTLPGYFSWTDTLLSIANGRHPVRP